MFSPQTARLVPRSRWLELSPPVQIAIVLAAIAVLAAAIRLWDIGSWPVFIDEDVYLWVANKLVESSVADVIRNSYVGKAPLPFLILAKAGALGGDLVIVSRVLAACAGTVTTVLCFILGRNIAGTRVGLVTALLYAASPVAVLHERMALLDSPLVMLSLGALLLGWAAVDRQSWLYALLAFVAGAMAVQIKLPGIAIAPILLLLPWTRRDAVLGRLVFACAAAAGPVLSYVALMVSPVGAGLAEQNADLQRAPSLGMLRDNLLTMLDSVYTYLPAGLALFVLAGVVLTFRERPRVALWLVAVLVIWSAPWLLTSRFVPSRYFLPALPFAYAAASVALTRLPRLGRDSRPATTALRLVSAAVAAATVLAGVQMVANHTQASLSALDDWQYRSGWPSGYAYREATELVARSAVPGAAVAYAIDTRHAVAAGLLNPPPDVRIIGLREARSPVPVGFEGPLYVITDDGANQPTGRNLSIVRAREPALQVVGRFTRPGSETGTYVLFSSIDAVHVATDRIGDAMDALGPDGHTLVISQSCDSSSLQEMANFRVQQAGPLIAYPPAARRTISGQRVLTTLQARESDPADLISAGLYRVNALSLQLWFMQCGELGTADRLIREWLATHYQQLDTFSSSSATPIRLTRAMTNPRLQPAADNTYSASLVFDGGAIRLVGYDARIEADETGQTRVLRVSLRWEVLKPVSADYHVFVHLLDRRGSLVSQSDGVPIYGRYPFTQWQVGETMTDWYDVAVPPGLNAADLQLSTGLYDFATGARLGVEGTDSVRLNLAAASSNGR